MALVASSVAQVCKSLAQYLGAEFGGLDTEVRVLLGSPADAATSEQDSEHHLNLFFFRFEPSGFEADTLPGETQYLRMHCLATPFAIAEDSIGSGENDLRIIGEVLRVFQEKPVFEMEVDGQHFHLQVMFQTLGMDQINQLWSTQGDTIYRPSVLFEVSLAPVVPREPATPAPLAGTLGLGVAGEMETRVSELTSVTPPSPRRPNTEREDWAPAAALVYQDALVQSLSLSLADDTINQFTPRVWVVGKPGTEVTLRWELWDAEEGWKSHPDQTDITLHETQLLPEQLPQASVHTLQLPFKDRPGQLVLYAERRYQHSSDEHPISKRSNPLLINLYEEAQ